MDLRTITIDMVENEELTSFGFYDEERHYGLGFSRLKGQDAVELMIADQSVYDLDAGTVELTAGSLELRVPEGTIKTVDGEDFFRVCYAAMPADRFEEASRLLEQIFEGKSEIVLTCISEAISS